MGPGRLAELRRRDRGRPPPLPPPWHPPPPGRRGPPRASAGGLTPVRHRRGGRAAPPRALVRWCRWARERRVRPWRRGLARAGMGGPRRVGPRRPGRPVPSGGALGAGRPPSTFAWAPGFEPSTFRLRGRCFQSDRTAPVGFSPLTLGAASVWSGPDRTTRVDWMTMGMTMAHSILHRVASTPHRPKIRSTASMPPAGCAWPRQDRPG
jgi:hypothetical protein